MAGEGTTFASGDEGVGIALGSGDTGFVLEGMN